MGTGLPCEFRLLARLHRRRLRSIAEQVTALRLRNEMEQELNMLMKNSIIYRFGLRFQ